MIIILQIMLQSFHCTNPLSSSIDSRDVHHAHILLGVPCVHEVGDDDGDVDDGDLKGNLTSIFENYFFTHENHGTHARDNGRQHLFCDNDHDRSDVLVVHGVVHVHGGAHDHDT